MYSSAYSSPGSNSILMSTRPPSIARVACDVLVALCLPVLDEDVFTEPASVREIAETLVVTEAAVKQHLLHLYDKFGVTETGERRRVRLGDDGRWHDACPYGSDARASVRMGPGTIPSRTVKAAVTTVGTSISLGTAPADRADAAGALAAAPTSLSGDREARTRRR